MTGGFETFPKVASGHSSWEWYASMPTFTWRRPVGILEENRPLGSKLVPTGSETEVLRHVLVPEKHNLCKNISIYELIDIITVTPESGTDKKPEEKMLVPPFAGDQPACQHLDI